ncbi:MAG: transporter [Alphaproteobacteria bacterium]|nr:transporter [Alphaproteobacteria bacterium]MBV8406203.1 transporter [Alphaproteobacteria bacterium]
MRRIPTGAVLLVASAMPATADEGGSSIWIPGQYASFAAVPGDPGFSLETVFFVGNGSASQGTTFPRGGRLLSGTSDNQWYAYTTPTWTFEDPVLAGQLAVGVTFSLGGDDVFVSNVFTSRDGRARGTSGADSVTGVSDLYPSASLKWTVGRHNVMAYLMGSVPTGAYDPNRLAGVGAGHWAIDWGTAYTFLSGKYEFSLTAGTTYNFVNPSTQYQSGMDGHLDFGTSYALTPSAYVGAVGYFFDQLSPDTGGPLELGGFYSRVAGAGPQVGWSFAAGPVALDVNLRGYKEFASQNRPEGWNAWLTVSLSPAKRKGQP